jgi:galactokinase
MEPTEALFADEESASKALAPLYGSSADLLAAQILRYREVLRQHRAYFGAANAEVFSSPGRAEIGGNHTDHNGGRVLTAAVSVDAIAAASPSGTDVITVYSNGYREPFVIELKDLSYRANEIATSALIRGVCAGFWQRGHKIGGFSANISSTIALGSGLSSSAAIELLMGCILNSLFNQGAVPLQDVAKIGQFAENNYWKKPSGLLDQMGCGIGGLAYIDFKDKENPRVERITYDFEKEGYKLLIVNTGGSHADLTELYAGIPREMWSVAEFFGRTRLVEVSREEVLAEAPALRKAVGDRAILRSLHFFAENERVDAQALSLKDGNFEQFLSLVRQSGRSSWCMLQNCFDAAHPNYEAIPLALALGDHFLKERGANGAIRVHGGGFAGTVLAIVPAELTSAFQQLVAPLYGERSVTSLNVRNVGAINVSAMLGGAANLPNAA